MKYNLSRNTFFVAEILKTQLTESGKYAYYLVEKKDLSHKQLLKRLPKDASFCGVKDRNATTKQYFSSKQLIGPIDEENLKVKFVGFSKNNLFIGAHKGNAFKVLVELNENELKKIRNINFKKELIANYFGEQRFSKKSKEIFEFIEKKDYENALKCFLCEKTKFDSEKGLKMKQVILENWGNWKKIKESKEIKDTGKVVLFDFLEDNPNNFKDAFSYAEPKSVKQLAKTMQSIRWNKELNKEVLLKKPNNLFTTINFEEVAISASKAMKREIEIQASDFEKVFFKKALNRKTFFFTKKFSIKQEKNNKYWLNFELGKGEYATTFLKYLEKKLAQD